jgi:hypothetical protein
MEWLKTAQFCKLQETDYMELGLDFMIKSK